LKLSLLTISVSLVVALQARTIDVSDHGNQVVGFDAPLAIMVSENSGAEQAKDNVGLTRNSASAEGAPLRQVELFEGEHPRVFNFRVLAAVASYHGYAAWRTDAAQFSGIIGKVLNEEYHPLVPNREQGAYPHEFFNRFKAEFPDKLVFLHYNGRARYPGDTLAPISKYLTGHWLYHEGSKAESAIVAEPGLSTIQVADVDRYRLEAGQRSPHLLSLS